MTSPIPLKRLLLYRRALDRILAELRKQWAASGKPKTEPALPVENLLKRTGVPALTFREDTRQLGLKPTGVGLERFLEVLEDALSRAITEASQDPASLACGNAEAMVASLAQAEDRKMAHIREQAWEYATAFGDDWLPGLAWSAEGKLPFAHQLKTAKRVIESLNGNALIADEVGLGKTITAGLVIADLTMRGLAESVLIIVPPNLKAQWLEQLAIFFDFHPAVIKSASPASLRELRDSPAVLIDYYRVVRYDDCLAGLLSRRWSVMIVDEAHRLQNPEAMQSRRIYSIPASRRILMTATPVQNAATDIHQVVSNLRPGLLGSRSAFVEQFVAEDGTVRESDLLKSLIAEVQIRTRRRETELRFPEREIQPIGVTIESPGELDLYNSVLSFLQQIERHYAGSIELAAGGRVRQARSIVLLAMQVLRELSSHPETAILTLDKAMRKRLTKMPASEITREDLNWLDKLVRDFKKLNWSDGGPAKTQALVARLPEFLAASSKIVVYAGFLQTIKSLETAIQSDTRVKVALFTYTGLQSRGVKSAVIDRFRAEKNPALLLSTDSGGEGLNLQEAGGIVNFDFPWNPMRVEQRIGRVDRVGQLRSQVFVWNMITEGTIEEYVYSVLEGKLDVCTEVLGDLDSPITRLMLRNQFEDLGIGQIILSARDPADLKAKLEQMLDPDAKPVTNYGRKSSISL